MFQAKERAARTVRPFPDLGAWLNPALSTHVCRVSVDNSVTILALHGLESRPIFLLLRDD
jgi:hypothetical protein